MSETLPSVTTFVCLGLCFRSKLTICPLPQEVFLSSEVEAVLRGYLSYSMIDRSVFGESRTSDRLPLLVCMGERFQDYS